MKKYLIIALSLLAVLMGAVACEKQGAEEEDLPGVKAHLFTCTDNENGIKWTFSFSTNSICSVEAKTSKGHFRDYNNYSRSNTTYKFNFPFIIRANISSSGNDEKYYFESGELEEGTLIISIARFNADGSRVPPKEYIFK